MNPRQKSRSPKQRDPVVIALLVSIAAVIVLCSIALWMISGFNNTPTWWTPIASNTKITERSGIELENRITTALTRLRPAGEESWNAAINQDQLNSWITHRLKETIRSFTSSNPDKLPDDIRINIDSNGITIGTQIKHAHGSTIVWAVLDLGTDEQGRFVINTKRAYIGNPRIPAGQVAGYLTSENLGSASVDLGDGRIVRILGIRAREHRLEFALRTETIE